MTPHPAALLAVQPPPLAAVPDLTLSRLWVGYLDYFRGVVTGHTGLVRANDLPMRQWPQRLFSQDWTYPALSALVRSAPGQGIVVIDKDYRTNPPFEPSCGTVPRSTSTMRLSSSVVSGTIT